MADARIVFSLTETPHFRRLVQFLADVDDYSAGDPELQRLVAAARDDLAALAPDDRPAEPGPLLPGEAVDLLEATMRANQGTHGDRWRTREVRHHVGKAFGHALSAGPLGRAIDDDTGLPHLALAATRLVLAVGRMLGQEEQA